MIQFLKCIRNLIILVVVLFTPMSGDKVFGQETQIEKAESFEFVRIYTDASGESHFGQTKVTFNLVDYAPPAPPISVSDTQATEGTIFISSPAGWSGQWHPAPRRQLMFCLAGELEVTVSDGETRRFSPGCPILVEDTYGQGHISRVVGNERCFMAAMPFKMMEE